MFLSRVCRKIYLAHSPNRLLSLPPSIPRRIAEPPIPPCKDVRFIECSSIGTVGSGFGFRGFSSRRWRISSWGDRRLERFGFPLVVGSRRCFASQADRERSSKKTLVYLTVVVFAMVGCTYAAVPLYRTFCQATGYGGTVQRRESVEEKIARHAQEGTATSRELVVQFNADVADGMPWKFIPTQREVRVKPGESALAFYTAENCSSAPITGVSTYNVTPMKALGKIPTLNHANHLTDRSVAFECWRCWAAVYFNKIQCFCFEEQRLLPGEQIDMPVFFYIDPEFETDPKMDGINNLILSYTFFKVSE